MSPRGAPTKYTKLNYWNHYIHLNKSVRIPQKKTENACSFKHEMSICLLVFNVNERFVQTVAIVLSSKTKRELTASFHKC